MRQQDVFQIRVRFASTSLICELMICRYKYCFKAPDYCSIVVDEIDAYLSGRLLTASEATWRFLGLKLHKEYPSVVRLDVHLPQYQNVVFDPTLDVRDIFEAAERSSSSLLEWFALNIRDPSARQHLYCDIPAHYVWLQNTWMPRSSSRKNSTSVGRMYAVSIRNHELFSLRTLLKFQRGCTSYTDILCVDGVIYSTFREACSAFGLVENDTEFIAAFSEYLETSVASIKSIRSQFVLMLCAINTINAQSLFEHFAADLIGTDSRRHTLRCMEAKMRSLGKSLKDFDIFCDVHAIEQNNDMVDIVELSADGLPPLSEEQSSALNYILEMVSNPIITGKVMAVVASAGTGKTHFIRHGVAALNAINCSSMCVAASGLAATLLPKGQTAHAALKIPIVCDDQSFCSWSIALKEHLRNVNVIFWDEISMVSFHVVETVDRSFKYLMQNDQPFGGKVVVFCGDFRQLPPVVKKGKGEYYSIINRDWFLAAPRFFFTKNFRLLNDESYDLMLQRVGDGLDDQIEIPNKCIVQSLDDAISRVFGVNLTDDANADKVMLAYTLHQCSVVNDAVFEKIPGDSSYSYAFDDLSDCSQPDLYPSEYVASLEIHGCPPGMLSMKPKARYMIMRNLYPPAICNGIMAELIRSTRFLCSVKLLNGPGKGSIVCLPRTTFYVTSEESGLPFSFKRRQFPLTPAYCLSVHKSQGQSLKLVGLVGDADAFSHGQVFVALSRVGSWDQFVFFSPRSETFIKNKVSKRLINAMLLTANSNRPLPAQSSL